MITFNYVDCFMDCQDEQQFKMAHIKKMKQDGMLLTVKEPMEIFCIESEETVKGFPDVLRLQIPPFLSQEESTNCFRWASFLEYKFTKNGIIKFQPSQLAFFRKYAGLKIHIIAYNSKTYCIHSIPKEDLFEEDSPYYIGTGNTLNLSKAEKDE